MAARVSTPPPPTLIASPGVSAATRLLPRTDDRLQVLMDRNTGGVLRTDEKEELEALVELSAAIRKSSSGCSRLDRR